MLTSCPRIVIAAIAAVRGSGEGRVEIYPESLRGKPLGYFLSPLRGSELPTPVARDRSDPFEP